MQISKKVSCTMGMLMLASSLVGCSGAKNAGGVKTLHVWSHNSHSKAVMTEMINDWNNKRGKELGVKIEYTVKESEIQQAVEMAFASDQEPDMFTSCNIAKYSDSGDIVPIASLPGGDEFIKKYTDLGIDLSSTAFSDDNGDVYCVPFSINTFGLVYNKDMFKKYGIVDENGEPTPPKTFEEVREYAKKMTNEAAQDYGIIFPMKWGGFYGTDVEQLVWGSAGRGVYDCVTGEYDFSVIKPIWEMYMGIKEDGSYFPMTESLDNDMARAYFAERNIGMKFAGSFDVGVYTNQFPAKCDWGVAPYPVADDSERYRQWMGMGGYFAMSKSAVEKVGEETAFEVFKFLHSDEILCKLYEKGMNLPYNYEIVKDVNPEDETGCWQDFAALSEISTNGYSFPDVEMTGEKDSAAVFLEELWMGAKNTDDAVNELNKRYSKGKETYYKNNADKDVNKFINKDWDSALK